MAGILTNMINSSVGLRMLGRREELMLDHRENTLLELEANGITVDELINALTDKPFFHKKRKVVGWMKGCGSGVTLKDVADIEFAIELIVERRSL